MFEKWVSDHLAAWLNRHIKAGDTCEVLKEKMQCYHKVASVAYGNQPEAISIMLLTILELWIACDKSATKIHAHLSDYIVEVFSYKWDSLLLRSRGDMERLHSAEEYLKSAIVA